MSNGQNTLNGEKLDPIYISIDGGIAGGKSTLIKQILPILKEEFGNVVKIDEPVKEWQKMGILKKGYDNPHVWAFPAQCVYFYTRIKEVKKQRKENPNAKIFIAERSPYSDTIFWDLHYKMGLIDPELHPIYHSMWEEFQNIMPKDMKQPTLFIYLKISPEECMKRAKERNRKDEKALTLEYQTNLIKEHDDRFASGVATMPNGTKVPVHVLELEDSFDFRTKKEAKIIAKQIIEKIKSA
jgi:deoxyadenosine/deoxycytidine kinase